MSRLNLSRPLWLLRRFRAMSPGEIAAQSIHVAENLQWRFRTLWSSPPFKLDNVEESAVDPAELLTHSERIGVIEEADDYLSNNYDFLGISVHENPMRWCEDPQTGISAPRGFAFATDYRDVRLVGNVRNTWEKSRFHHGTILALAYRVTHAEKYAQGVEDSIRHWIKENPVLQTVNWSSALELGIRLISWSWILRLIRGSASYRRLLGHDSPLWQSIYWHQRIIVQRRSRGSSANNHLIGEMVGLFVSASAMPAFPESRTWRRQSLDVLCREIPAQTFSSGLNREQAFGYHLFVLEFALVMLSELQPSSEPRIAATTSAMLKAAEMLLDSAGHAPRYGDGDEGQAVQLRPRVSNRVGWLQRLARSIGLEGQVAASHTPVSFPDAGVYVLVSKAGSDEEVFCVADAGQHGFLSIAAHGHADALSFTLSVAGKPVIVDCGTYCYYSNERWRNFFRGTRAHNTVLIDGRDQAESAGPFLWVAHPRTVVHEWLVHPQGATLSAEHDGYSRLLGKPIHRRTFSLDGSRLLITDLIMGSGEHDVEWRLHLAPDCSAMLEAGRCTVTWASEHARSAFRTLSVILDDKLSWAIASAAADAGWYSARFNKLEPTITLVGRAHVAIPLSLTHMVEIS